MSSDPGALRNEARFSKRIRCPQCRYSLRGLAGHVRRCPECGTTTDVTRLIARRHRSLPRIPEFMKLQVAAVLLPVALSMFASVPILDDPASGARTFIAILGLVLLVSWFCFVVSAVHARPDREAFKLIGLVQTQVLVNFSAAALFSLAVPGLLVSVIFLGFLERELSVAITVFILCLMAMPAAYAGLRAAGRLDHRLACSFSKREMEMLL